METRSHSSIRFNFRAPGQQPDGPLHYAIGDTALGKVMVVRSQAGICSIFVGDDAQALLGQLARACPALDPRAAQAAMEHALHQVIAVIDGDEPQGVIELDVGGTAFEQAVWQALCRIPPGETRSYAGVARELGMPTASRAVAGACAANVFAIAIPCHRVLRSDGSLSGYRWGVGRKRALLAREAQEKRAWLAV